MKNLTLIALILKKVLVILGLIKFYIILEAFLIKQFSILVDNMNVAISTVA